jgi:hypothetical protein
VITVLFRHFSYLKIARNMGFLKWITEHANRAISALFANAKVQITNDKTMREIFKQLVEEY